MQPPWPESTSGPMAIPQLPASNLAQAWPGLIDWPSSFPIIKVDSEADFMDAQHAVEVMAAAVFALHDYGLVQLVVEHKKTEPIPSRAFPYYDGEVRRVCAMRLVSWAHRLAPMSEDRTDVWKCLIAA